MANSIGKKAEPGRDEARNTIKKRSNDIELGFQDI